jgi:hypothetical protein
MLQGAFIDVHGNTVLDTPSGWTVAPQTKVQEIGSFHDGLASVLTADRFVFASTDIHYSNPHAGYIDHSGRIAIPMKYTCASDFSESMSAVQVGEKWGYVDTHGKLVIPAQYDHASPFSEGLALVEKGWTWGFIDHAGKMVLQPGASLSPVPVQQLDCAVFHEGLVPVIAEGHYGFMDRSGRIVIEPKYADAHSFSEGIAAVELPQGQWVYIDVTGRVVLTPKWNNLQAQAVGDFSEGLAAVQFYVPDGR